MKRCAESLYHTRLEDQIQIFVLKRELLHSDGLAIQHLLKKLKAQNAEFKKHHYSIMELLKDEEELDQKQATLDNHDDRIADIIGRLLILIEDKDDGSPAASTTSAQPLGKQLDRFGQKNCGVQDNMEAAQLQPEVHCLLQQLEEPIHVAGPQT